MVEPTHLKNMLVKLDHCPKNQVEDLKNMQLFETTIYIKISISSNSLFFVGGGEKWQNSLKKKAPGKPLVPYF